jgi:dihydrofolate reductase
MRKVVLKMDMSLDGYVGPLDEDAEWIMRDFDDELSQWVVDEVLWQAGTHVMGRATYEEMADHWPSSTAVFAAPMNEIPKVVFSKTLTSAEWPESRIAGGDLAEEMSRLKQEPGKDILVHGGSSSSARSPSCASSTSTGSSCTPRQSEAAHRCSAAGST